MKAENRLKRRKVLQGSVMGIMGLSLPFAAASAPNREDMIGPKSAKPYPEYPSLPPSQVSEVVGKSHFDLDRVKELVEARPELARATWEWRFGDFEAAIGAASHVGRRDIVLYLLSKGASPSIFTFATLGAFDIVKSVIELSPGIQTSCGPHGISLLQHARAGLRMEDSMSPKEIESSRQLISYLEDLGNADGPRYQEIPKEEMQQLLGDYKYGAAEDEGFTVQLNMREQPSLGPIGGFGGALYKIGDNLFTYNGAPSVRVSFQYDGASVQSIKVIMPGSEVTAKKI